MVAHRSDTAASFVGGVSEATAPGARSARTVRYRSESGALTVGGTSADHELTLRMSGVHDVRLTPTPGATVDWTYVALLVSRELVPGHGFRIADHAVTATVVAVDGDELGSGNKRVRVELAALVSVDADGSYMPGPEYVSDHVDLYVRIASDLSHSALATVAYEVVLTGCLDAEQPAEGH